MYCILFYSEIVSLVAVHGETRTAGAGRIYRNSLLKLRGAYTWEEKNLKLIDKYIIGSHLIEELRNTKFGWSNPKLEPMVKRLHYNKLEHTLEDCYDVEAVVIISMLDRGLQPWLISGQCCVQWDGFKMYEVKELGGSDVASLLHSTLLPPYNNGSKG